ncbi:MAG: class I adenylate-forming enzyme family protein, partial [Candidatus Binatia bacterium]
PGAEDAVRIRYTSGTAGLPKGAVLPRRCYDASVEAVADVIGPLGADDVLAQVAPMTHAAGAMWLPHALAGASALLVDRFDAAAFVELAAQERVTSAFLVPTMLVRFLEALGHAPRAMSFRSIVYGGASMPVDRLERGLELLGPVFVQIYGLTESNWPVTALRREEHVVDGPRESRMRRLASCGRPTAVGELRIVTAAGREATTGETGEVLVRGRNTMLGYWGKGERDAKGLDAQGWMHTGDVASRDADGFVTIVDRLHDMIVSGGFNVYPREVEDALSSHAAVLEAAVVGRPDPEWGECVHAVVVLRPGAACGEEELAAHVAGRTAAYKKPRSFEFVTELPKNAAGKVLRRALKTTTPPA